MKGTFSKLFYRMLPIQALIVAMGAVNSIIDGYFAGHFIGPQAVGVIGLFYAMTNVLNAVSSVILGGTSVLCGRFMGRGDMESTQNQYRVCLVSAFSSSALISAACLIFPGLIARMLGASGELAGELVAYIRGYAFGMIPMVLAAQLAAFLQMERESLRGYAGIAGMILSNCAADYLLVSVIRGGLFGLALSTSLSNWVYFLILASYSFTGRAQLRFRIRGIRWNTLWPMIRIGFPGALLIFCISVSSVIMNRILLRYAGEDGLSAFGAFNMVRGILIAYALGVGAVTRMLVSVLYGEEDRQGIRNLMKLSVIRTLPVSAAFTVLIFALSRGITTLFFSDAASEVFRMTEQLIRIYACCIPLIVLVQVISNYLQAIGFNLYVNILSVFDGLFSTVLPSIALAPLFGALGIWLSNPIGLILTSGLSVLLIAVHWKHFPRTVDEWLLLDPSFGVPPEDALDIVLKDQSDAVSLAERVQRFCREHGMQERTAYFSALCVEEMTWNVIKHGFVKDKKEHILEAKVVCKLPWIILNLKDDCVPFNPKERAEIVYPEDPLKNAGVRVVSKVADELVYQHLLGLNVLTIRILDRGEEDA